MVVTVPSFWVSTTRMEPSWNLVVSVTVPVFLSVTVVVLEPSLLVVVSAVVLLLEPPPPPEEEPEEDFLYTSTVQLAFSVLEDVVVLSPPVTVSPPVTSSPSA